MPEKDKANLDLDAMLLEAGFVEPEPITLRWKGKNWKIKPTSAVDPRALANMGSIEGVVDVIADALGPKQAKTFPIPRGVILPNGKSEMEFFLDAWSAASGDGATSGE